MASAASIMATRPLVSTIPNASPIYVSLKVQARGSWSFLQSLKFLTASAMSAVSSAYVSRISPSLLARCNALVTSGTRRSVGEAQLQGRPGLAGAFWAQMEQHSGCGAASPSQGHRDPDSLRAALSLGGEAPAWECSLGRFLSLGKSSPRGRLWQCAHPQPLSPLQGRLAPRSEGKARAELRQQSGTTHGSHTAAACSFPGANARSWAGLGEARPAQSSLSAGALCYRAWAQSWSSAGVEAHSVLPSTALQAPAGSQPLLSRVPGIGLQTWDQSNCPELTDHGLVPLRCGSARKPKRPGEACTAHPPASRRQDSSREGPVWQALSGHKRSNTLAVELPPQARGTGTLIPSVRRLVWAGKPQLGNAAWGASFPSERALPAGGFGSVHTPSP